jgi:2-keto-3-deoxy-L-rhamnonate aldolase RhmA
MHQNRVKAMMKQGRLAVGAHVGLADPAVVEIIGLAGFDAAFIDTEHTAFDVSTVENMIRACELTGITSIVRVPDNNPKNILRILDAGAQGIHVPHIADVKDALAAVKAVRYAPLGERGMASSARAARYGAGPLQEHLATSNAEILLTVMIEDKEALDHLAEIASVPGVDLVAIGPNDLAAALGITSANDPRFKKTIEDIAKTLRETGKARMAFPLSIATCPLNAAQLQSMGIAYANCNPSTPQRLLLSYRQQMQEINAQLG